MDPAAVPYAFARWMGYLGSFLVIGAVVFQVAVLRNWTKAHPGDAPIASVLGCRAARLGLLGGMVLIVAAGLRLWCQLAAFVEPGEPITRELLQLIVTDTPWGRGWVAQLGAAVLALGGYLAAIAAPRAGWIVAGIGATLVAAAAPMTGHAVTPAAGATGQLFDALHLLAGSAWLGTLAVTLVAGLLPLTRLPEAQRITMSTRLIRAFSPVGLVGASLAVVAGSVMSWRYLGTTIEARFDALLGMPWGQVLLIKVVVLGLVAGLGAWNWRILLPRLGTAGAARSLHRSAQVEILLGLLLLVVTAILVALPMPAEAVSMVP